MADIKEHVKPEEEEDENYSIRNNADPKNMQELTQFVSFNSLIIFYLTFNTILIRFNMF